MGRPPSAESTAQHERLDELIDGVTLRSVREFFEEWKLDADLEADAAHVRADLGLVHHSARVTLGQSPALGFMVRPDIDVTFVGTELDRRVVSLR